MPHGTNRLGRRTFLKSGVAAGTLVTVAGCLGEDPDQDEFTITLSQFPDTIDPLDHITGDYFDVYDHIYEPLFDFEPGEGIFPRVVDEWEATEDGVTELQIIDDVVFHNGDELTAEDIAWTINRTVDPDLGVPSPIGTFGLGSITGAEAVDDTTLEVMHSASAGLAEFEYGNYARAIPRDWAIDNHDAENEAISGSDAEDFNGTGPYEVVDFTSGEEIVLERFDDYWGDEPPFERVVFNADGESSGRAAALETQETDLTINILPEDVDTVDAADGVEIRDVTSFRTVFCPMKNTVEPFDSQEFRQAMNYAVDNEGIVNTVLSGFGEARGQPVSPGINGFNDEIEPYAQDVGLAESLVEDSGYGGAEIELQAPQGRYLNDAQIAEQVADQIDQLDNVDCSVNIGDFEVVSDANQAGVDPDEFEIPFYMIGWGVITGDTDYGVQGFFTIPDNPNRTFEDEELSDAILESQQIDDPDERRAQLEEVNALAHEKAPFVYLHTQESIYGIREEIQWDPREDETVYLWEMEQ
ncbi:ABC transporter substrate-binding protein [Natranaeroarchaeum aerophilus]|uniref:ABC transporter substrate-binding protein n=1 Tax=Natranaeroarchaeum aerophilus TaxID=2917711 RepID=A0AAE3K691_9EURY|nr:ABC transporter substrate-binding protein [Natranaeroarchaeum aerophilus]MCL9814150.1 ABC transporter substrate-binding protein [Natranaeroarchaeum aerophilus]